METPRVANAPAGFGSGPTPSRPAAPTLPPDLAREGVRRLRWVAALTLGANLFFIAVGLVASADLPPMVRSIGLAANLAGVPLTAFVLWLASNPRLDPRLVLDLALVYEVVDALLVSLADPRVPLTKENGLGSWSGVAVWVLVFPILIPNTRGKIILASIASAAMDPVGKMIYVALGAPPPDILPFAPTALAAVLGIVVSRLIFRMSVEASRARELGSYRLVEPLGSGGMGEVWRAEHRMLARPAAIKLIRTDSASGGSSREMQRRFEREARATARLSSPHTVQIYDYGTTEEGTFYYVMELLEGFDLETIVRQFGPLPPERAIHLLHQACLSLAEAHQRGFTHRDIKPANIYVCHYGIEYDFVKILDFGLVKSTGGIDGAAEGTLTAVGTIAGTPGYMSPEMALGREVDARADIYSLACVGYWLLTGRPVFESDSAVELLIDHARTRPPRLSERAEGQLPEGLEEILFACLEKAPDDRPQSADEVATSLERIRVAEGWTSARARRWWLEHPAVPAISEDRTVAVEAAADAIRRVGPAN
jgi:eukaryotic-like serine/threonine-protein kinase